MGGSSTPGIGWGGGIERLVMLLDDDPEAVRPIFVIPIGEEASTKAFTLTQRLRNDGFVVELGFTGNVGKRLKQASKANARAAILLGEAEIARGQVTLRDLDNGTQIEIAEAELGNALCQRHM